MAHAWWHFWGGEDAANAANAANDAARTAGALGLGAAGLALAREAYEETGAVGREAYEAYSQPGGLADVVSDRLQFRPYTVTTPTGSSFGMFTRGGQQGGDGTDGTGTMDDGGNDGGTTTTDDPPATVPIDGQCPEGYTLQIIDIGIAGAGPISVCVKDGFDLGDIAGGAAEQATAIAAAQPMQAAQPGMLEFTPETIQTLNEYDARYAAMQEDNTPITITGPNTWGAEQQKLGPGYTEDPSQPGKWLVVGSDGSLTRANNEAEAQTLSGTDAPSSIGIGSTIGGTETTQPDPEDFPPIQAQTWQEYYQLVGMNIPALEPIDAGEDPGTAIRPTPDYQGDMEFALSLSPAEQQFYLDRMSGARGMFEAAQQDVTAREQEVYNRIRAAQTPEEERQRLALEQRLANQGRLGTRTAMFGGTPEQLAMAQAQEEAKNQSMLTAMQFAGEEQERQAALGSGMLGAAYIPQAQLLNALAPGMTTAEQMRQAQQAQGTTYAQTYAAGLDALLASRLGQANMARDFGTSLASTALGSLFR